MADRLYKARDRHGKLLVYEVPETTPVPDDPRALTHAWLRDHAEHIAVRLHGPEWSYRNKATGVWETDERPDFDRLREVGR